MKEVKSKHIVAEASEEDRVIQIWVRPLDADADDDSGDTYHHSICVNELVIIDYDEDDDPIGVELIGTAYDAVKEAISG